jgi:hypothetical protein
VLIAVSCRFQTAQRYMPSRAARETTPSRSPFCQKDFGGITFYFGGLPTKLVNIQLALTTRTTPTQPAGMSSWSGWLRVSIPLLSLSISEFLRYLLDLSHRQKFTDALRAIFGVKPTTLLIERTICSVLKTATFAAHRKRRLMFTKRICDDELGAPSVVRLRRSRIGDCAHQPRNKTLA